MTKSAEQDHPEAPTAKKSFVGPLAQALREHTYLSSPTPIDRHAHDLLDNLATALSQQETQTRHHPIFIHSPSDAAMSTVVRSLQEAIGMLPEPHHPSVLVISETGWKDLNPDMHDRLADCIIVHQNEPLSEKQQNTTDQLAIATYVIVCATGWGDIGMAMEAGLLRPIDRKPLIATRFADQKVKEWFRSGGILTNDIAIQLARDDWFIESLAAGVFEETNQPDGMIHKLPIAFVHAADEKRVLELLDLVRAKLPLKFYGRVAAIEDPNNLTAIDQYTIGRWGRNGKEDIDILIAPTIPPHYRAPGNLKIIFLQPGNHFAVLESILVRALQPSPSPAANPITVRELTPPDPEKRKFITVPVILGWYSEPEPVIEPEPSSETLTSKPKRLRFPLITHRGTDLTKLSDEEFNRMADGLTKTQRACLEAFRKETPAPTIARDLKVSVYRVYSAIHAALLRLDKTPNVTALPPETPNIQPATPEPEGLRGIDHPKVKKEKTHAPRARKPFLFEGQSLIAIQEEQRKEIYTRAHLNPREIVAIESYIYAVQQNLKVYEHVAQTLSLKIARVGWVMTNIRKKLAHPEMYEPKTRGEKPAQTRETGNPKRNGNVNLPSASTQKSHGINPQSDGLKF